MSDQSATIYMEGDQEIDPLFDHAVDLELLAIYEGLEFTGAIIPVVQERPKQLGRAALGLNYVTRAEWGARAPRQRQALDRPDGNTAHYEGPAIGEVLDHARCYVLVRGIQAYHMDHNNWSDIAYNFVVCQHGVIFEGRGFGIRSAANGTNVGNSSSWAHCVLIGAGDAFTPEAQDGLKRSFGYCRQHGSGDRRWPHSHWFNTACPGDFIRNFVVDGAQWGDVPPPTNEPPVPPPLPPPVTPPPPPMETDGDRIRQLQRLIGVAPDAIMGPMTQEAMNRNLVGWYEYARSQGFRGTLAGNDNHELVRWLQRQFNRKVGGGFGEDGLVGPNTNHGIVVVLGQPDGVCGPHGFTAACGQ